MAERNLGFIGVGRMGGRMARRLIEAGYDLTIFDADEGAVLRLAEMGARAAGSAAAVGSASDIVIASLPTPAIVETVALGTNGVAEGGRVKVFVDMSTSGAAYARRVAAGLAAKGIVAVDAPVSGGLAGAEQGTLAVMVSCPEETLRAVQPILEVCGKVFFVGTQPGQGQTMKLLNNLLSAAALAISSEAMVMGVKAGLDARQIIDVINAGTGRNSATQDKFPKFILPRTFNAGFSIGLFNKDLQLCLEEADALGVPMVVGTAVRQLLSITMASEGYDADMTTIAKTVERWAGVVVEGRTGATSDF